MLRQERLRLGTAPRSGRRPRRATGMSNASGLQVVPRLLPTLWVFKFGCAVTAESLPRTGHMCLRPRPAQAPALGIVISSGSSLVAHALGIIISSTSPRRAAGGAPGEHLTFYKYPPHRHCI